MTTNTDKGRNTGMDSKKIDEALDVIAEYATMIATRDGDLDRPTPTVAQTLDELFESKAWVDEYLAEHPAPKRPPNNWTPDSRSRFTQWTRWKASQTNRASLGGVYQYRLLNSVRVSAFATGKSRTLSEYTARPLHWMLRYGYEDRMPDVWARAVALAGSEAKVDGGHTKQALADWKREVLGPKGVGEAIKGNKARSLATKTCNYFDELVRLAATDQKAKDELVRAIAHFESTMLAAQQRPDLKAVPDVG